MNLGTVSRILGCCLGLAVGVPSVAAPYTPPAHDLCPAVQEQVDRAYLLANGDFSPDYLDTLLSGVLHRPAPPTDMQSRTIHTGRVFDNLYFIGLDWVSAWALDTPDGIILFDTLASEEDARAVLVPGLRSLGLDPARIRKIVITHGHFDHFGGAPYLHALTGAPILMSAADWTMIGQASARTVNGNIVPPARGSTIADGDVIAAGKTAIHLYLTPGHTPGTVSAIFAVTDHGIPHMVAFFGGNGLPTTLDPTDISGGLRAYRASLDRFTRLGIDAGADSVISNHPVVDNAIEKLAVQRKQRRGGRNPWVIGKGDFIRLMGSNLAATDAAIADLASAGRACAKGRPAG